MSVLAGAVWRGNCANNSGTRPARTVGVVLHVNDGPNVSLWSWVNNPNSNMSCHFQVLQDGTIEQYLDTDRWAWCQADGNAAWVSIEMPTVPTAGMTAAQVKSGARILAAMSKEYGFPLQLTNDPNGTGFGFHGMGGAAWGGHTSCPGDIRKAQRADILALAKGSAINTKDWFDMASQADLENAVRKVLNEGTPNGQTTWAGGNKAVLAGVQGLANTVGGVSSSMNDTKEGLLVRVATLQAQVTALKTAQTGAPVDTEAIAASVVAKLAAKLGAA